jgi:transposase InsO family protein
VREQRKQEDIAWKAVKTVHSQAAHLYLALSPQERKQQHTLWQAKEQAWWKLHKQRQQTLRQRQQEDAAWHQRNRAFKVGPTSEAQTRAWIAILVVTDNCTRHCLGVPIFRTGSKLTSQEVVAALWLLLPEEQAFLISDQCTHFRSAGFAQLAQEVGFIHVPVYRHRPQSNGITERFVLTLKKWVRSHPWQTAEELAVLLALFLPEYNDHPHQGLPIPGLSPNEFANRIWLM